MSLVNSDVLFRFEEKSRTINELDEQLQKLHFSTEALAEYRRNLAISAGHVSKTLQVISMNEDNQALSGAIAQLAEVQKSMEQIHHEQVTTSSEFPVKIGSFCDVNLVGLVLLISIIASPTDCRIITVFL